MKCLNCFEKATHAFVIVMQTQRMSMEIQQA